MRVWRSLFGVQRLTSAAVWNTTSVRSASAAARLARSVSSPRTGSAPADAIAAAAAVAARERAHRDAARDELAHEVLAEESGTAGDEGRGHVAVVGAGGAAATIPRLPAGAALPRC